MMVDDPMPASPDPEVEREVLPPTRSGRIRHFPNSFEDFIPSGRTAVPHMPMPEPAPSPPPPARSPSPAPAVPQPITYETTPNEFGLYRSYTRYPTTNPDAEQVLEDVYDAPGLAVKDAQEKSNNWFKKIFPTVATARENIYHPFLNATVYKLMDWFYNGSTTKSAGELDSLVKDVLLDDDFDAGDLQNFSVKTEIRRMEGEGTAFAVGEGGWQESTVTLTLPHAGGTTEASAPVFTVPGVWHRDIVEVIRAAFEDVSAKAFHYSPFRLFWRSTPDSPPERVYSEVYNSDVFLEEHEKLQQQAPEPGCDLERVIAALMVWSDSTHLTNFGHASLWPIYLSFGNQSKYSRAKPSDFSAHHLAYIPAVRHLSISQSPLRI